MTRRTVGMFLILLFWLGPLTALIPANAESSLPACCRRHGDHHCALSNEKASKQARTTSGSSPVLSAPAHCPSFPGCMAASTVPVHALVAYLLRLPAPLTRPHFLSLKRASCHRSYVRTRSSRGPPASNIG